MKKFIPVASPALVGNEKIYVNDCLDSNWISSNGKYIEKFEHMFSDFCGVKNAISCSNGTVALHLALLAIGIGPGDEVIVPTLTYVSTANAVVYCGAKPVFVDSDQETWNLDPKLIELLITPKTKAIIVVHLYGHPVDMDPVMSIAKKNGLIVVEDAAEAHGAEYKGLKVGSIGDIATFSFYGNKIITTGEGGMVVTQIDEFANRVRQLKGQGMDPNRRYWFPIIGYNYRMTNIEAALGLAQLEKIDWHLSRRKEIASQYFSRLKDLEEIAFQPEIPHVRNVYWLTSILISNNLKISRDTFMKKLSDSGIETRPFFYPLHTLPIYQNITNGNLSISEYIAAQGINLPSFANLSENEIDYVCDSIINIILENY
jgi:perosamine synthetase